MGRSRPSLARCAGQLKNACELSMRPYRTNGFSAPPDTWGGCTVGWSGVDRVAIITMRCVRSECLAISIRGTDGHVAEAFGYRPAVASSRPRSLGLPCNVDLLGEHSSRSNAMPPPGWTG